MNPELEKLGSFFAARPIIIPQKVNSDGCVYALDFSKEGDTLENIARKGLWWTGRQKFVGFGIDNYMEQTLAEHDFSLVSKKDYPDFLVGIRSLTLFRMAPNNPRYLSDQQSHAREIIHSWKDSGNLPNEVQAMFQDGAENRRRLECMVGKQTYKHHRNNGFNPSLRGLMDEVYSSIRKGREEMQLDKLVWIVADVAYNLRGEDELSSGKFQKYILKKHPEILENYWWGSGLESFNLYLRQAEQELKKAVWAIARVAYNMRHNYPRRGWEVRHGIVHYQGYGKLERLASAHADPELVRLISERAAYDKDGFKQKYRFREQINRSMGIATVNPSRLEEIGKMRVQEFLRGDKRPYSHEAKIIEKMLRINLNRRQFRAAVNQWMEIHSYPRIIWDEIPPKEGGKKSGYGYINTLFHPPTLSHPPEEKKERMYELFIA